MILCILKQCDFLYYNVIFDVKSKPFCIHIMLDPCYFLLRKGTLIILLFNVPHHTKHKEIYTASSRYGRPTCEYAPFNAHQRCQLLIICAPGYVSQSLLSHCHDDCLTISYHGNGSRLVTVLLCNMDSFCLCLGLLWLCYQFLMGLHYFICSLQGCGSCTGTIMWCLMKYE